jgi:hypothetical protein
MNERKKERRERKERKERNKEGGEEDKKLKWCTQSVRFN